MNDSNELVDRVLEAVGHTEPGPGFKQRIAHQLQERLEQGPRAGSIAGFRIWLQGATAVQGSFVITCAGTAVAVAILLVAAGHHKAVHRPIHAALSPPAFASPQQVPAQDLKIPNPPMNEAVILRSRRERATHEVRSGAVAETVELELARAPSMLAPPMPLTAQERLLQRVAERRRPESYALLNPAVRARSEAEDRTSFLAFFEPPRPPGAVK